MIRLSLLLVSLCWNYVVLANNSREHFVSVIPKPQSVSFSSGQLILPKAVKLDISDVNKSGKQAISELLTHFSISTDLTSQTLVKLQIIKNAELNQEGYQLDIDSNVIISANSDTGLFYGVQTLWQLLMTTDNHLNVLPKLIIQDRPEYGWRGNMLDVARSFLPLEYLKAHIDRMAHFKLNRLHLHLSDDQGWRIEIEGYPKLTEVGGASAVKGGRSGYYTQSQIRELVEYAKLKQVTLIPEIDLPGHTQAAIASYNKLACDDVTNLATYDGVKVGFSKLCLTKPDVIYPFVETVLTQLAELFPSKYIHIGGDEIKDPLYGEFISKAAVIVEKLGRTAIAWEEGSVADTSTDVLFQLWNDKYNIQPALDKGHQIILSPCSYTYFDHGNYAGQPNTYDWCRKEGVPLERAYQFNPQEYKQAVGVESAMWSELVHTDAAADNRLWPRLLATAELGWTKEQNRNYQDFLKRVNQAKEMMSQLHIQFYEPESN